MNRGHCNKEVEPKCCPEKKDGNVYLIAVVVFILLAIILGSRMI